MRGMHEQDGERFSKKYSEADAERDVEGYTLAFDACSTRVSFCLWDGGEVCLRWADETGKTLAEDVPWILSAQEFHENFSYRSLRRICFVRGPGSYTGLRAALSVARGLRLACGKMAGEGERDGEEELERELEIFSVTSFEAGILSSEKEAAGGYALSLVESFRGVWYGQAFVGGEAVGEARVLEEEDLRLWVWQLLEAGGDKRKRQLCLCGGGVGRALEVLENFPKDSLLEGGVGDAWGFSRALVRGDRKIYRRGEEALKPIYMGAPV